MNTHAFWTQIRQLGQVDVEQRIPRSTLDATHRIFREADVSHVFVEVETRPGALRSSVAVQAHHFEMALGQSISIEETRDSDGVHLDGFSETMMDAQVYLFCDDREFETSMECGQFEFHAVPEGSYRVLLRDESGSFWIQKITIGEIVRD